MYGICHLSIIPVRAEPSHRAEMTTQLLAGETYSVLNEQQEWLLIKLKYDSYEGWIDRRQFREVSSDFFDQSNHSKVLVTTRPFVQAISKENDEKLWLPRGCDLPMFTGNSFYIGEKQFLVNDFIDTHSENPTLENLALSYLYTPYLWGGRSPAGIDCSGFTQMIYKLKGIKLPRDAHQQAATGETISFISEAQPGDLAFFENSSGNIIHTGMILDQGSIIHASALVRIDPIDHHGIFSASEKKYTHILRLIKRHN